MSVVEKHAFEVRKWHKIVKKPSSGEVHVMPIVKIYSYGSFTKRMIAIVYRALSGNEQTLRYPPIAPVLIEDGVRIEEEVAAELVRQTLKQEE